VLTPPRECVTSPNGGRYLSARTRHDYRSPISVALLRTTPRCPAPERSPSWTVFCPVYKDSGSACKLMKGKYKRDNPHGVLQSDIPGGHFFLFLMLYGPNLFVRQIYRSVAMDLRLLPKNRWNVRPLLLFQREPETVRTSLLWHPEGRLSGAALDTRTRHTLHGCQ
jgi:hypothetical protein